MESFKAYMNASESKLNALVDQLKNIYPGLTLFVSENDLKIHVHEIKVKDKNRGTGTKVMQALQQYARLVGKPITLSPSPEPRKKAKLLSFYKKLGFRNNRGRHQDYTLGSFVGPTWVWRPEQEGYSETQRQDEWIITDGMGEFVRHYNPTGNVMVFTKNREEAWKTNDSESAYEVARIAQVIYKRKHMRIAMI